MSGAAKAAAQGNGTAQLRSVPRDGYRDHPFAAWFEGATLGISACTLDGKILESNTRFAQMLGYRREELSGTALRALLPADLSHEDLEDLKRGTRLSYKTERRVLRKDGSQFWGLLTFSLVLGSSGEPTSLIALLEDATANRHADEKSREAEKMEVIGRLAGGIAHDFNNLLTGVLLYCDLLSDGIDRGSPLLPHVEEIRLAGEQGAALTQQLLALARKQVPQPRPMLLNDVLTSTENLLRRLIGEQIKLITRLAAKLPSILADPAQVRQIVMNLVLNARDAMPHGGCITVRTQARQLLNDSRSAVSLTVEDNGCGMDESTRARLFEPFFTTKPPGHGTGLGLATVQRIVAESGGAIEVQSRLGHGTTIQVLFPALARPPAKPRASRRSAAKPTILLVDDHTSARHSIQRILDHAGYRVLPASSGARAVRIFAESAGEIGLLLADWTMPGMTGRELAEKLTLQKPKLKVLLISGYHNLQDGPSIDSAELIRKPFAGRVLLERIRKILSSKGDAPW